MSLVDRLQSLLRYRFRPRRALRTLKPMLSQGSCWVSILYGTVYLGCLYNRLVDLIRAHVLLLRLIDQADRTNDLINVTGIEGRHQRQPTSSTPGISTGNSRP